MRRLFLRGCQKGSRGQCEVILLKGSGWTVRLYDVTWGSNSTEVKWRGHFSGLKILNDFLNLFLIFFNLKHFHEVDWSFRFSFEFWTELDPFHLKPEKNEDFLLSSKLVFKFDVVEFNCPAPGVFWSASWNNFVKSVGLSHDGAWFFMVRWHDGLGATGDPWGFQTEYHDCNTFVLDKRKSFERPQNTKMKSAFINPPKKAWAKTK